MFGLGIPEILFIVLVAIVILGPEQMPRAARLLGQWSGKIRSASTTLSRAIREDENLRDLQTNFESVRNEIASAKQEILKPGREIKDVASEVKEASSEIKDIAFEMSDATTGRSPQKTETEQEKSKEPEKSTEKQAEVTEKRPDFIDQPLNWFLDDNPILTRDGHYELPKPFLLPGEISRQVSREKISLPEAVEVRCSHQTYSLPRICLQRAFLRTIKLNRKPEITNHKHMVLPAPDNQKIPNGCRSLHLPKPETEK